jgi:integrase
VPLLGERCVVSGRELASAPPTGLTAASEALGLASGGGAHTDPAWQERKPNVPSGPRTNLRAGPQGLERLAPRRPGRDRRRPPQAWPLADAIGPRYRALVLVAAYGGLRWGELVGLRIKRVDLLHGRVTVAEQVAEVNGRLLPGPPKTEAGRRTVTLPALAAVALAEHLAQFAEPGPDGLVFPAPEGGYLGRSNFRRRCWLPATTAAGVEGLRFHDLRHSAATLALAAGANTRELMERMGHTSPAVALRYQHVMAGRDQAIAAAL